MTAVHRERLFGALLSLITAGVTAIVLLNVSLMRSVDRLDERVAAQGERLERIERRVDGAQ